MEQDEDRGVDYDVVEAEVERMKRMSARIAVMDPKKMEEMYAKIRTMSQKVFEEYGISVE
tara:strand:+ start:88357 stop:88536 length:180 start_codon:yes stop_codon:yes gene_type:complete